MRKKLFAVIMSAMMLVTFMPAMAFATVGPAKKATGFYYDSYYMTPNASGSYDTSNDAVYDGAEHTLAFDLSDAMAEAGYSVAYYDTYYNVNNFSTGAVADRISYDQKTAPKVKNAGFYTVVVGLKDPATRTVPAPQAKEYKLWFKIAQRPVRVVGFDATSYTKMYDGKGFTLDDSFFTITPLLNPKTKAYDLAGTGLVAGDKLFSKAFTTSANVGEYYVNEAYTGWNPNYIAYAADGTKQWSHIIPGCKVTITQATNYVKLPKSNMTYTAKALKKGAKSFALKATAEFGTAKITKVQGSGNLYVKNGKVVVKKGTKKGTYKMTVNAHVQGTTNWAAADINKVVCVKVR